MQDIRSQKIILMLLPVLKLLFFAGKEKKINTLENLMVSFGFLA